MKVLSIDTSNLVMGIAVTDGEKVIGEYITNLAKNHSTRVMPAIQQLLADCGILPQELEKIVVAMGPGSYTGLRIGVTIAKTLAWTLGIPLVGVSSLETLAANGKYFSGVICPLFDARRGQVYTGLYHYRDGVLQTVKEDTNILLTSWLEQLKHEGEQVLFLGNDVHLHKETIQTHLGDLAVLAPHTYNNPRPSELALIGGDRSAVDVHQFVPNYIRLAEAEANWLANNK